MPGPLEGLRVLAMAGLGPAPFASMLLADLGADVVRVTRPAGRPARASSSADRLEPRHDLVNRGVRSLALDITTAGGVETVLRLVQCAEVLIEGFRPGVMERRGLGPDVVLARNTGIVYARLTGYGQSGPLADAAGHDINYVAHSGVLHSLPRTNGMPQAPLNLLGDYAAGGTVAAFGILASVLRARSTGLGEVVDAAMVDGLALLTTKLQGLRADGAVSHDLYDDWLGGRAPFYTTYRCADGRHLAVGALESEFFASFLRGLDVDLTGWPAQHDRAQWDKLRALIAEVIATRPMQEWVQAYAGTDACVSGVLTFEEAASDTHNRIRSLYSTIDGALHPAPAPRPQSSGVRPPQAPVGAAVDVAEILRSWGLEPARHAAASGR